MPAHNLFSVVEALVPSPQFPTVSIIKMFLLVLNYNEYNESKEERRDITKARKQDKILEVTCTISDDTSL